MEKSNVKNFGITASIIDHVLRKKKPDANGVFYKLGYFLNAQYKPPPMRSETRLISSRNFVNPNTK